MRDLLSAAGAPVIAGLARPGTLLVFDFDGTLAPLLRARGKAQLGDGTRRALARVAEALPTAVLSGRAWPDLAAKVAGVPIRWAVGGHGAEWPGEPPPRGYVRRVAGWRRRLDERLAGIRGVDIEDKEVSLSIHWRAARDARAAAAAVARAAADLPGARLVGGKRVLNVVPAEAPDKGDALARLVAESGCERVLFVGDDVTDEAGFRARLRVPAVMVRVGRTRESAASWFVQRRGDVDRLLERLATAPPASPATLGAPLEFMRTLWALEHGLNRRSKDMLRRFGVTGPQRLVVRVVGSIGPVTPGQLAKVLHLHPASVTRLAHALERRGFLRRRPDPLDRRRLLLELGPAAPRIERIAAGTIEAEVSAALERSDPGDVAGARRVVEAIADGLLRRAGPRPT